MRTPSFGLTAFTEISPRAPLAVMEYWLQRRDWFRPWRKELAWAMQTRQHAPADKLLDALVSILAGCERVVEINTKLHQRGRQIARISAPAYHETFAGGSPGVGSVVAVAGGAPTGDPVDHGWRVWHGRQYQLDFGPSL